MTAPQDEYIDDEPAGTGLSQNKAEGVSPGEILRESRLAHQYSIDDLSAQTKISPKTIAALEDNEFDVVSPSIFVRGYYRQCAKVLDIDPDRITRAYKAWAGEPADAGTASPSYVNVIPQDVTPGGRASRFGRLFVLVGIVIVAILIGLYFVPGNNPGTSDQSSSGDQNIVVASNDNGTPQPDNATSSPTGNAPTDTASGSGEQAIAAGGTPSIAGGQGAAPAGTADQGGQAQTGQATGGRNVNQSLGIQPPGNGDTNTSEAGTTQQSAASTPAVPPNRLVLTFTKRSWVRVTDANGNRMASGIFEAGQTKEFNGTAPYEIRMGYAPGVKVTIGGQAVDVAARTNGSSVATLTVKAPSGDTTNNSDNNG